MLINLSIVVHPLPIHMLTSFYMNEILLPRYVNWSTIFRSLQFNKENDAIFIKTQKSWQK